ncbi:hypothetical protein C8F01DRAFT_1298676 [Mycena amicta]|nr:hypothetical protein C8F01DRAFT_1298676 [Mycena amicta]
MAPSALTIRDDPHSASKLVPDLPTVVSVSPTSLCSYPRVVHNLDTSSRLCARVCRSIVDYNDRVLAPPPPPATTAPTAVYTTITQVLTTVPVAALPTTTIHETPADTTSTTLTTYVHTTAAGFSKTTSSARSSSVRTGPSPAPSSNPTLLHKAKSNTGKYVGLSPAFGLELLFCVAKTPEIRAQTTAWLDLYWQQALGRPEYASEAIDGSGPDAERVEQLV